MGQASSDESARVCADRRLGAGVGNAAGRGHELVELAHRARGYPAANRERFGEQCGEKSGAANTNSATEAIGEAVESSPSDSAGAATLVAANDAEDFTLLPGSLAQETGDAAVVRVRLQRGALGALGLPVNEERAGEWIQVDLFVGQDGQPQAVRLPR